MSKICFFPKLWHLFITNYSKVMFLWPQDNEVFLIAFRGQWPQRPVQRPVCLKGNRRTRQSPPGAHLGVIFQFTNSPELLIKTGCWYDAGGWGWRLQQQIGHNLEDTSRQLYTKHYAVNKIRNMKCDGYPHPDFYYLANITTPRWWTRQGCLL